jgi:signal transduction histidine kinase
MIAQHLAALVPPSAGDARTFLSDAAGKAMGRVSEWEGRRKDGTIFPFELSLFEFETDSGKRIAGNVRDISERREVERLKNEFISTVSHELRTPLTSIRGSLSLISSGMFGSLPAEALELVGIAQRNSERLIGLINDILDLDRLDTGRMTLEFADVAVADVLARAAEAVDGMAKEQGVRLVVAPTSAQAGRTPTAWARWW